MTELVHIGGHGTKAGGPALAAPSSAPRPLATCLRRGWTHQSPRSRPVRPPARPTDRPAENAVLHPRRNLPLAATIYARYESGSIRFAHKGTSLSDEPPSLRNRMADLDPDQLETAVIGTRMRIDRLSASSRVSPVKHFWSDNGWALGSVDLHSRFRAAGSFPTGRLGIMFVTRANGSTICGTPVEDGMILALPVGTMIEASVTPGLSYVGVQLSAEFWSSIRPMPPAWLTGGSRMSLSGSEQGRLWRRRSGRAPGEPSMP